MGLIGAIILGEIIALFSQNKDGPSYTFFVDARKSRVTKLHSPLPIGPESSTQLDLIQRGLLNSTAISAKSILDNCQTYIKFSPKFFRNPTLGFVTPWNKKGFEVALRSYGKFDYLVPVWYQVKLGKSLSLNGQDSVDTKWIKAIRSHEDAFGRKPPKILPRIHFDHWTKQDFISFLNDTTKQEELTAMIIRECSKHHFEGVFFDFGSLTFEGLDPSKPETQRLAGAMVYRLIEMWKWIGTEMHKRELLVFVAAAPNSLFEQYIPFLHPLSIQRALTPQIEGDEIGFDEAATNEDGESEEEDEEEEEEEEEEENGNEEEEEEEDAENDSSSKQHDDEDGKKREGKSKKNKSNTKSKSKKQKKEMSFSSKKKKGEQKSAGKRNKVVEEAYIDGVVLMTYDYSSQAPGPNAPLDWQMGNYMSFRSVPDEAQVKQMNLGQIRPAEPTSLFVGMPFYGYEYINGVQTRAILGSEYIDIIRKYKTRFTWDEQSKEHVLRFVDDAGKERVIYYPSIMSLRLRAQAVSQENAGLAVWELGQGLDYFTDAI
ncbi:putative chitinase domain containing 1 precursor [Monocercomonoides exilis]|uniref:putative chitinase domain containing 1 precursor n=1 Tax=Monocercomonoides exilis TaxID=2049356 RepID=UPI00355A3411|nr:putative chitinase domain containing 1 precursor [Monocercomonoides exilis]|eukprot:MONOS_7026.1-p1 / transcript=MONOS_7026.1 / gene=MONOS_7026 / organism=Monocercomonoides_exilis_PA203 / gene_product=chitinase domain containing 1 precursor / transcript_product=chitinase domain containing 1 precursor / location=Mono_scaffold00231:64038-66576(+) / protein_length=542 / sequence_SO=supercontig / SO=protein_coding / is_pseudo=false